MNDGRIVGDAIRILQPNCVLWYEVYKFFRSNSSLFPPSDSTNVTGAIGQETKNIVLVIVAIVGSVLAISIIAVGIFYLRKSKRSNITDFKDVDEISTIESLKFNLGTILAATDSFSESNKIGEGGFGVVYKGMIDDQELAIKRLSENSGEGAQEFKNEALLLAKLQHKNLVRLLGFCLEGNEKLLIYEYIKNPSLDRFILDPIKRTSLNWERRYNIILGIARGLQYLHEDSSNRIIHRDLKASNILLDEEMNAKIADFGQARLFVVDQTQGRTSQIVGTHGYMSPEYLLHGHFSVKSDVFSFGVLILEIISGQRNNFVQQEARDQDLLSYAWRLWTRGTALELLDPTQREHYSRNEVMQCIQIGLLCVQEDVAKRLTMRSIVLILNSYSITILRPSPPAFFVDPGGEELNQSTRSCTSVNDVSITELHPP